MLQLLKSGSPSESLDIITANLPRVRGGELTVLISDLKSKLEIQKIMLGQFEFLSSESVLRASELWKILLFRTRPDWQVISREFTLSLIGQYLKEIQTEEVLEHEPPEPTAFQPDHLGLAHSIYNYITQLMPILSHPNGAELVAEWFEQNPDSATRWGKWYLLATQVWEIFLREKLYAVSWASGVLGNELNVENKWTRSLIVDLGAELSQVEAGVLIELAKTIDIFVIEPQPVWASEYQKSFAPYELLRQRTQDDRLAKRVMQSEITLPMPAIHEGGSRRVYKKFTTSLAEVKDAVSTVRELLDQGHQPSDIAIVAPDIEVYWPVLRSYLQKEGIPVLKSETPTLGEFREVASWLAELRLRLGIVNDSDLELSLFTSSKARVGYDHFEKIFRVIYGKNDLGRDADLAKHFAADLDLKSSVRRDDFFIWTLKYVPSSLDLEKLEGLFKKMFEENRPDQSLQVELWLNYLQTLISRTEVRLGKPLGGGIDCSNLSSNEHASRKFFYVLGLTEESLKTSIQTAITNQDTNELSRDLGFQIFAGDHKRLEFQARWVLESEDRDLCLSYAMSDFTGDVMAPSWIWLQGAEHDEIQTPGLSRWDEQRIQKRSFEAPVQEPLKLTGTLRLSASSVENYLKCPFIFKAQRFFNLTDQSSLDLDVDPKSKGDLLHKIFEYIFRGETVRFDYTDDELLVLIDQARLECNLKIGDERLWPTQRKRYLNQTRRFIEFERRWRIQFPDTKTLKPEIAFKVFADLPKFEFSEEQASIQWSGKIDRVDVDPSGNAVIIDYKSGSGPFSQHSSWLKNDKLQLALYAYALQKGLTEIGPREVVSAVYYVVQKMNRDYGFKVSDAETPLFDLGDAKKNKLTRIQRDELIQGAELILKVTTEKMMAGEFPAEPKKPEECNTCKWRELCRAPHLIH